MDNALYVGLSRQMVLRRELDIVANNIANADTSGFKVESLMSAEAPTAPAKDADGPRPIKFTIDRGVARDFGQGAFETTGNPFDVAIEGQGFFTVQTAEGERYTRNGRFGKNEQGMLATQAGEPVLGDGGEIRIDPQKGQVSISADGSISQGGERIGKLSVVRFDDLSQLEKVGDNFYRNVANLQPQPAPDAQVRQGMLEGSNVKPIVEVTKLIEVSRAYEAIVKMMDSQQELSRRSVERMGRVQ